MNSILRVKLFFIGEKKPELGKTRVLPPGYDEKDELICNRGKRTDNSFQWGTGPLALSLFFVGYAAWCSNKKSPRLFEFSGKTGSPADRLETTVLKKCDLLNWTLDMFGNQEGTNRNHLTSAIEKFSSDKSQSEKLYRQGVNVKLLPIDALTINWRNANLTKPAEFEELASKLQAQWKNSLGAEPAVNISTSPVTEKKKLATNTPWLSDQTKTHFTDNLRAQIQRIQLPDHLSTLAINSSNQPLAVLFAAVETTKIKNYILSELSSLQGQDAYEDFLSELLLPECIKVIAEKLVGDTIDNFVDFYAADYDSPPSLKRRLAACIANDPDNLKLMAAKVARSGNRDMNRWFEKCVSFFPDGILIAVEEALIHEIHGDPNFKLKFNRCSLRDLCELIAYFKDYGRDYLVFYLTEICFEDDMRRVREAYAANPKIAERFVSIIGKEQFRSCIKRFLNAKQIAGFRREIDTLAPKK